MALFDDWIGWGRWEVGVKDNCEVWPEMVKSTGDASLGERARLWFQIYQVSGVNIQMEMEGRQLNISLHLGKRSRMVTEI